MKIHYLGSAAYDAIPSPFCHCATCVKSRKLGGKNLRTRAQAILNDDLLLDFNPDTVTHFLQFNIDWDKIDNCLITHNHSDHLYVDDICIPQYATDPHFVHYYSGKSGYDAILQGFQGAPDMVRHHRAEVTLVEPFREFTAGGYRILPLPANHDQKSTPLIYAIERDGKRLLYGHDSGYFFPETVEALKGFGKLDLISMDCTGAVATEGYGPKDCHMGLETNRQLLEWLTREGIVDEQTVRVVNHFSHNGCATHEELLAAAPKDYIVGYDGLCVEF